MGEPAIVRVTGIRGACAALVVLLAAIAVGVAPLGPAPAVSASSCDGRHLGAAELNEIFAHPGVGGPQGYAGGDYPHAYTLPGGRVLWLFQDIFYSGDDDLRDSLTAAAHNGGLVQDGDCFTPVGGPGVNAVGNGLTQPLGRWFWPLDGEIGYDGALWIFFAEMRNPNGTGAGLGTAPVATWVARLDPVSLAVVSFAPAPDAGTGLYGWSVVSDDRWSYLFGHCYRQYIHDVDGPGQFDSSCMPDTYLARVPVGHFDEEPEYWTASGWGSAAGAAVPILHRSYSSPISVQWFGDVFVSVSKVSDWWGTSIEVDRAHTPEGPWQRIGTISTVADRRCSNCGNYGAFLMPWLDAAGNLTIALSNGAPFALWYANANLYRPSFYSFPLPTASTAGSASGPPAFTVPVGDAGFQAVDPVRLVDTRAAGAPFGRLRPGAVARLDLRSRMPAGTRAVALNLSTVDSAGDGWVRAYPCDGPVPPTSSINPVAGDEVANAAIVPVGAGEVCFATLRDTDLVVDLDGWLTTGSTVGLAPVTPRRLVDTRDGTGGSRRLRGGTTVEVQAVAPGSTSTAVALNVTAVDPGADGFVTAWPCGTTMPVVANLTPQAGVTRPNAVHVRVGTNGKVCLYSLRDTDLVVDLFAEYRPGAPARYAAMSPTRLLDTRTAYSAQHQSDLSYLLPAGTVTALQLNLTAVPGPVGGFLTAHTCATAPRPLVANVNYGASEVSGNATLALVGRGYACVYPMTVADVVVDLFGVWTTPAAS